MVWALKLQNSEASVHGYPAAEDLHSPLAAAYMKIRCMKIDGCLHMGQLGVLSLRE